MKYLKAATRPAVVFVTILLATGTPLSLFGQSEDLSGTTSELESVVDAFFDASRVADEEAIAQYFSPHATILEGKQVLTATQIPVAIEHHFQLLASQTYDWTYQNLVALSSDVGVYTGTGHTTGFDTEGGARFQARFAVTLVWIRTEQGWRIIRAQEHLEGPS